MSHTQIEMQAMTALVDMAREVKKIVPLLDGIRTSIETKDRLAALAAAAREVGDLAAAVRKLVALLDKDGS